MRKKIIIGGIVAVGIGFGLFAVFRSSKTSAGADEGDAAAENVPSVVTVQTGLLKRMTLHHCVDAYGTIEAAPATVEQPAGGGALAASSAGIVAKVNVVAGQHVEKGDVLVGLNSGTATFDYAQAEVDRQKKLYAQQNTSLKNLQDATSQLASLQIIAPVSGTVTRLSVKPGEAVDANAVVAEVIDLNRLAVGMKISAAMAGELKSGEDVQILAQPAVTTSLSFVSPAVDANDGTISAWASLPADSGLRPGQFVQLKIVTAAHTNCLAAPDKSVVTDETGKSVIALVKDDEAAQIQVKTGLREDDWVEVEAPEIKEGDAVVTVGAYGLPEKTKIRAVNP